MNNGANHDPTSAMSDGRNNPEPQTEEERIFFNEVLDEQLEAAASSPIVTFTLSLVLFACQFCPSDRASSECPLCTEFAFGRAWSEAIDQRGNSQRDQNDQSAGRKILRDGHGIRPSPHVAPQKTTEHGLCTPALSWLV